MSDSGEGSLECMAAKASAQAAEEEPVPGIGGTDLDDLFSM